MRPLLLVMRRSLIFLSRASRIGRDGELLDRELPVLHLAKDVLRGPVGGLLCVAGGGGRSLESSANGRPCATMTEHVVVGELVLNPEPLAFGGGEFAELLEDAVLPLLAHRDGDQVGSGK